MNAKEYLQQIRNAECLIRLKERELEKIKSSLDVKAVSYDREKVQGGIRTDRADLICKMIDYQNELTIDIKNLIDLRTEVFKKIERLKNPTSISLLYLRYFEFKTWEEIADELHYSHRWILKIHSVILKDFDKILQEDT